MKFRGFTAGALFWNGLFVSLALAACGSPDAPTTHSLSHFHRALADPERHFTVVTLGDSNTQINRSTRGHLNWAGLLAAGLAEGGADRRFTLINVGQAGDTATGGLQRLERDVIAYRPDLVIISYGMNDHLEYGPEQTGAALREIIRRLRAQPGECSILLRTSQPVCDLRRREGGVWVSDAAFDATMEAIRRVAREENVALVDHFALWTAPGDPHPPAWYCYDGRHPNENGHRRFYAELAPVLRLPAKFRWE